MTRTGTTRVVALAIAVPVLAGTYFLGTNRGGTHPAGYSTVGRAEVGSSGGPVPAIAASAVGAAPQQSGAASPMIAGGGPSTVTGPAPAASAGGITVSGTGRVTGTPDTVLVNMGLSVSAGNVSEALASANAKTDAVQKVFVSRGVDAKDLQTSGLNIYPNYTNGGSGAPTITGYQVSENLSVKLRDLSKAGDTITAAVAAGGDAVRVDGVSLDLQDTSPLVSAARDRAFGAAKTEAAQYAKDAGVPLGRVVSISDVFSQNPMPVYGNFASGSGMVAAPASVPIKPGSQDVAVTVTVVFALG